MSTQVQRGRIGRKNVEVVGVPPRGALVERTLAIAILSSVIMQSDVGVP